jgi:small subunit ribosomal protein S6
MHQYEVMVILDPTVEEKTVEPSIQKFLKVITEAKGTIDSLSIWGRRRLAYEIKKQTEGIYAVITMTAPSEAVIELDRQLNISEAVMRTKVLRAEDVQFTITPIEYSPERPARKPYAKKGDSDSRSDPRSDSRSDSKPSYKKEEAAAEVEAAESVAE